MAKRKRALKKIKLTKREFDCWESILTKFIEHEVDDYDPPGIDLTDGVARRFLKSLGTQKIIAYFKPKIEH